MPPNVLENLLKPLQEYQPYLVAVKVSPEVLREREKLRTDRNAGLAESQCASIYKNSVSDLEIDTSSLTAEQSADKIAEVYLASFETAAYHVRARPSRHAPSGP